MAPGVRIVVSGRPPVTRFPGTASGARFGLPDSPWARSLTPSAPQGPEPPCSPTSQLLRPSLISPCRASLVTDSSFPQRPRPRQRDGMETSQVPVQRVRACLGSSTPRDSGPPRHSGWTDAAFGSGEDLGIPDGNFFRCSIARPARALSTLDPRPRGRWPMTRGGSGGSPSPSCRTFTGYADTS